MMGKKKVVATQIKKDVQPLPFFTHCDAHSLTWHLAVRLEIQPSFQNQQTSHAK